MQLADVDRIYITGKDTIIAQIVQALVSPWYPDRLFILINSAVRSLYNLRCVQDYFLRKKLSTNSNDL